MNFVRVHVLVQKQKPHYSSSRYTTFHAPFVLLHNLNPIICGQQRRACFIGFDVITHTSSVQCKILENEKMQHGFSKLEMSFDGTNNILFEWFNNFTSRKWICIWIVNQHVLLTASLEHPNDASLHYIWLYYSLWEALTAPYILYRSSSRTLTHTHTQSHIYAIHNAKIFTWYADSRICFQFYWNSQASTITQTNKIHKTIYAWINSHQKLNQYEIILFMDWTLGQIQ